MNARTRRLLAGGAGLALGAATGAVVLALSGSAGAHRTELGTRRAVLPASLEVAHLPPLLTVPGESVELRYDIYCPSPSENDAVCTAGGTVYIRAGTSGPFRAVPLAVDPAAQEGRYVARVPADIAASPTGFTYYAVLRNTVSGASTTLPAGGAAAPQRSLSLGGRAVQVSLGVHGFAAAAAADARVARVSWGGSTSQAGLEEGPEETPIGGSSFDVDSSGAVTVLDEANRRALRFRAGGEAPFSVPLSISGRMADLALGSDGTMYVLEYPATGAPFPVVRAFDRGGRPKESVMLAEQTASQIRLGPGGPVTNQYPSTQWMPVEKAGVPLKAAAQEAGGGSSRPLPDGSQVVVYRHGASEIRAALASPAGVVRSWVVHSATPVAEVQLAQPLGSRLVLVFRLYTDAQDQFQALVLGDTGIVQRLSLASNDWAETAPLSRFRLVGTSLYQLGSTPQGLFVDRYDLEVG
jgi:hypothetical protein